MSLTSYLNDKKHDDCLKFQESIKKITPKKNDFKSLISHNKPFDTKIELKVEYNLLNTKDASLVGIAFDYFARFLVAQKVDQNKNEVLISLVSDNFFSRFEGDIPNSIMKKVKHKYLKGKKNIENIVITDGIFDNQAIEDILLFSKLEQSWRGNALPSVLTDLLESPPRIIIKELKELVKLFELNFLSKIVKPTSTVKYNPDFGICSTIIGGADADIFIDGTLYDFKCTKSIGFKSKDVQQIVGYYILDLLRKAVGDNINETSTLENNIIERIAIYSARIGEIYYIDVKDIENSMIREVVEEVRDILFSSRNTVVKTFSKTKGIKQKKTKSKKIGFLIFKLIIILILFILTLNILEKNKNGVGSFIKDKPKKTISIYDNYNIRGDYENKKIELDEMLNINLDFYRYYSSLIKIIKSYEIDNVEDAKVVYEISDELLNEMYHDFSLNWSEDKFNELTQVQLNWIEIKVQVESELDSDEMQKYKKLINMTIEKCEEWTLYYK